MSIVKNRFAGSVIAAAIVVLTSQALAQQSKPVTNQPQSRPSIAAPGMENVGCMAFTTREPAADEIVIDKVPFKIDKPGKYIVTKDLSADGSCIGVLADDVTIDLNGHTLRYGMGNAKDFKVITYNGWQTGNAGHSGILLPSRPDAAKDFEGFKWTGQKNITVRNGKIQDGTGEGLAYCIGLNLDGAKNSLVENVIIEVAAPDTFGMTIGQGSKVRNVTIFHNGTVVSNRHQQVADLVAGPDSEVSNCWLEGGPQAGVKASNGSSIHDNFIRHRATVTNCYGIMGYGQKNIKAFNNIVISYNGRGIHISEKSSNWDVYNNYVEVRETRNKEYPNGMQTHGIKFEKTSGSKIHDNVVLSVSSDGGAPTALNMDCDTNSNNEIYGNTFIALTINKEAAYACYMVENDGMGTQIRDNTFYTNNISVMVSPDGGKDTSFRRCTFRKVPGAEKALFYADRNYKKKSDVTGNNSFIDCRFMDGISPRDCYFPGKEADWRSPGGYMVGWSLTLNVKDGDKTLAGANVVVTDKDGKEVAKAVADNTGKAAVDLPEFTVVFDVPTAEIKITDCGPYTVKVSAGDKARQFIVASKTTMEGDVDLAAKGELVLTPAVAPVGQVEDEYSLTLAASGGGSAWQVVKGNLPDGLKLDAGAIKGKCTKAGDFKVTLGNGSATKDVSIKVAEKPKAAFWQERVVKANEARKPGPVGVWFDRKTDN